MRHRVKGAVFRVQPTPPACAGVCGGSELAGVAPPAALASEAASESARVGVDAASSARLATGREAAPGPTWSCRCRGICGGTGDV